MCSSAVYLLGAVLAYLRMKKKKALEYINKYVQKPVRDMQNVKITSDGNSSLISKAFGRENIHFKTPDTNIALEF